MLYAHDGKAVWRTIASMGIAVTALTAIVILGACGGGEGGEPAANDQKPTATSIPDLSFLEEEARGRT